MLRSILCLFRVDLDSELVQFWLHFGFSLGPFWFHFGSILDPFGVHFGSIWGPWRGPVAEMLRSRTEGRWGKLADPHFKRCWEQKGATRRPKIDQKSSKIRPKIDQNSIKIENCRALRLGSRLGGLLEASWARLRGQHSSKLASQIEGKSIKNRCKNQSKKCCLPSRNFEAVLMDCWKENEGMLAPKSKKN